MDLLHRQGHSIFRNRCDYNITPPRLVVTLEEGAIRIDGELVWAPRCASRRWRCVYIGLCIFARPETLVFAALELMRVLSHIRRRVEDTSSPSHANSMEPGLTCRQGDRSRNRATVGPTSELPKLQHLAKGKSGEFL